VCLISLYLLESPKNVFYLKNLSMNLFKRSRTTGFLQIGQYVLHCCSKSVVNVFIFCSHNKKLIEVMGIPRLAPPPPLCANLYLLYFHYIMHELPCPVKSVQVQS
jgi:hypothetical protein